MKHKKRKHGLILMAVSLCLFICVAVFKIFFHVNEMQFSSIMIGEETFVLERKETKKDRSKGLSGRVSLSKDKGLLFVFEQVGMHGFWMKDMNFPISIVWLDDECKVTGFKQKAIPESFPEVFYPTLLSRYVVETNPLTQILKVGDSLNCYFN